MIGIDDRPADRGIAQWRGNRHVVVRHRFHRAARRSRVSDHDDRLVGAHGLRIVRSGRCKCGRTRIEPKERDVGGAVVAHNGRGRAPLVGADNGVGLRRVDEMRSRDDLGR